MAKQQSNSTIQLDLTAGEQGFWLIVNSDSNILLSLEYFAAGVGGHQQQGHISDKIGPGLFRRYIALHFPVVWVGLTNLQLEVVNRTSKAIPSRPMNITRPSVGSLRGADMPTLIPRETVMRIPSSASTRVAADSRRRRPAGPYSDFYDVYSFAQYGLDSYGFDQYGVHPYGFYREERKSKGTTRRPVVLKSPTQSRGKKDSSSKATEPSKSAETSGSRNRGKRKNKPGAN